MKTIDAQGVYYADLNRMVREALKDGETTLNLTGVEGQRYIGDGISGKQKIIIHGTPGNDMAAYMDGPELEVFGNAQDAIANTMNDGRIIIHGSAGDTVGYAMRGGEVYIKGNAGYRVGIHMKEYLEKKPVIVIGGKAGDFFGEYMAGGIMLLLGLGLDEGEEFIGNFVGTGMHGGIVYIRGEVDSHKLGREVKVVEPDEDDMALITQHVDRYAGYFDADRDFILKGQKFVKLYPYNKRPYGNLYAY